MHGAAEGSKEALEKQATPDMTIINILNFN